MEKLCISCISLLILGIVVPLNSVKVVKHVQELSGTIKSPGYPNTYADNQDLTWSFMVKPGYKLVLTFSEFDLEDSYEEDIGSCVYDYVEITQNGENFRRFCGNSNDGSGDSPSLQKEIEIIGHQIMLRFVSDYSNEEPYPRGFVVDYKLIDRDECREKELEVENAWEDWDEIIYCNQHCHNVEGSYYCSCDEGFHLHSNKHTCTNNCQKIVLTQDKGQVMTSRYPKAYSKLASCDWTLQGKEGIKIDFRFINDFSIEEHYEEGCVYDWLEYEYGEIVSRKYCGTKKPNKGEWIRTDSPVVKIMFRSDLTEEEAGFKLEYKFNRIRCSKSPAAPADGELVVSTNKGYFEFEDVVNFTCKKGFLVEGPKSITCGKDGKWSASEPKCQPIVCTPPTHITGVKNLGKISQPALLGYGAVVSVECNERIWYEMTSGAAAWICGDEGTWEPHSPLIAPNDNNNIPECGPICGQKGKKSRRRRRSTDLAERFVGVEREQFLVAAIVRGKPVKNGEWPWMAFVDLFGEGLDGTEFCGGSLVSTKTVITAAHCTARTYKNRIKVFIGASERYNTRDQAIQEFSVAEIYQHENYSSASFDNDIAILILNASVKIGLYARPVCLPRSQREQDLPDLALSNSNHQKTGVIAGWGITESGYLPPELNMARIPPIEHEKCVKVFERRKPEIYDGIVITENMLCAGYYDKDDKGRDSCQGDSGGPLMFQDPVREKYFLNGVVSFGSTEKCGEGTFGIYAKVSKYIAWIDNHLA